MKLKFTFEPKIYDLVIHALLFVSNKKKFR